MLGELFVGILIGNMQFLSGWGGFEFLKTGETFSHLDILARIGVVLLLFEVGLESTVKGMMSVGVTAFIVACLGVVAPMILGFLVGYFALPGADWKVHLFLGATLSATSVGITARVLKDLGRSQQTESQIILGAAVIDDVLGLIVLAVVRGIVRSGSADLGGIVIIVLKAFGFLVGAIVIGTHLIAKPAFKAATYLRGHGLLVTTALCICFLFAWLASLMGLAPDRRRLRGGTDPGRGAVPLALTEGECRAGACAQADRVAPDPAVLRPDRRACRSVGIQQPDDVDARDRPDVRGDPRQAGLRPGSERQDARPPPRSGSG